MSMEATCSGKEQNVQGEFRHVLVGEEQGSGYVPRPPRYEHLLDEGDWAKRIAGRARAPV